MTLRRFSSRLEPLSKGFLDNRLAGAVAYDRIAGYFRSSVFEIAGEAFDRIDGPIRIVCNSGLDVRDVDVARALFNDWCEGISQHPAILLNAETAGHFLIGCGSGLPRTLQVEAFQVKALFGAEFIPDLPRQP